MSETVVDGVRTLHADLPGPLRAGLVFRVGQADEQLVHRGVTHLVEHLALTGGTGPHEHNGATGQTLTSFALLGEPADVADQLARLCTTLRALPADRLEHERGVLYAEAATHGLPSLAPWRWGARTYGLVGHPERGLAALTLEDAQAWADRWFHRANAVLWLSGPPPAGLRLPLGDGPAPPPPPEPRRSVLDLPAWFPTSGDAPALSMLLDRVPASTALVAVLTRRLDDRLRHERGLAYGVGRHSSPLTGDVAEHVVTVQGTRPGSEVEVGSEVARVLAELVELSVHPSELRDLARSVRLAGTAPAPVDELDARARALLLGAAEPLPAKDWAEAVCAVTADQVRVAAEQGLASLLLTVPAGSDVPVEVAAAVPRYGSVVLSGPEVQATDGNRRGFARLVLAPEGVSAVTAEGEAITVRYDETVLVRPYSDGTRVLVGADGLVLTLVADEWYESERVTAAVDAGVDASVVHPVFVLPVLDGAPSAPAPRRWRARAAVAALALVTAALIVAPEPAPDPPPSAPGQP